MTGSHGIDHGIIVTKAKALVVTAVTLFLFSSIAFAEGPPVVPMPVPPVQSESVTPTPPPETAPAPAPAAPEEAAISGLVLQLFIDNAEMLEFIEGLQVGDKYYLPLGQFSQLLDFPITIDAEKKAANGWFISEKNKFSLTDKEAEVRGEKTQIVPGMVIPRDNDLYIESSLLSKWLPLDFSVDLQRMVLSVTAHETLPYQASAWRKGLHEKLKQQQKAPVEDIKYTKVDTPYGALEWPSIDLTLSPSYQSTTGEIQTNYSALAAGDFGFLTARLNASGNFDEDYLTDLRVSLGRDDYYRELLGPLRASSFSFGDIDSATLDQGVVSGQGRGFKLTSRALDRPDRFDVTRFIGDAKPDWDVELYRNETLLAFQTVGSNGRYEFADVPILFGNNDFRIVLYGPQGQKEEITKTINADSVLLEKGEFTYNFSADQKGATVFGITPPPADTIMRAVGEVEYGVSKWLTATMGAATTIINDKRHNYVTSGMHTSLGGKVLTALDSAYDVTDGGYSSRLAMSSNYLDTDIQFTQKIARDFISEENAAPGNLVTFQTDLNLNREMLFPVLGMSTQGLNLTRKVYESDRTEYLATHRFSKEFSGLNFTNTLFYDRDNLGLSKLSGGLSLRGSYNRYQIGLSTDYDVKPLKQLKTVRLTGNYPISRGINGNVSLSRDMLSDVMELENSVTLDMKHYNLSLTARADTEKRYFAGVTLNTSIGRIPDSGEMVVSGKSLSNTGAIAVRPFLDRNYNQVFDAGDEALKNVGVKIGGRLGKKDKHGFMLATQLPENMPVQISLDQEKQENPYLTASGAYSVTPRAGKIIKFDFPLFETSQIDGTVTVPDGADVENLQVNLVNTEGQTVSSTHTAFDGYYLIEGVMPGTYKVRIADDSLSAAHLSQPGDRVVTINKADFYIHDIKLAMEGAAAPTTEAPPAEVIGPPAPVSPPIAAVAATPPAPVTPPAPAVTATGPTIGDVSGYRTADYPEKTRFVLDMTVKADPVVRLSQDGKTIAVDLSQLKWLGEKFLEAEKGNLISGYHIEGSTLYVNLMYASRIETHSILFPNKDSKNYRLVIDLFSPEVHK